MKLTCLKETQRGMKISYSSSMKKHVKKKKVSYCKKQYTKTLFDMRPSRLKPIKQ